jgi:hypothetical protein
MKIKIKVPSGKIYFLDGKSVPFLESTMFVVSYKGKFYKVKDAGKDITFHDERKIYTLGELLG